MATWQAYGHHGLGSQDPSWATSKPPTPPDQSHSIPPFGGRGGGGAAQSVMLPTIAPESPQSPTAVRIGNQTLPTVYTTIGSPRSPDDDTMGYSLGERTIGSHAELEEKRRYALREKEREMAARQRQRDIMQEKREAELARKFEIDQQQTTLEMAKLAEQQRERDDIERRRLANIAQREQEERDREAARRQLAQVERKREHSLRMLEMQRLREEEMQRATRESVLAKRKEMERVRDQADRLYHERKVEESARKVQIVQEMKDRRDARLVELERRRLDPVLMQQEREFSQLIEVQASVGRLQTKLEQSISAREDTRERLLEARHHVEMLEVAERQQTIGVVEAEADLRKLLGYEQALARLVTTRYAEERHERAAVVIQRAYRGALGRRRAGGLRQQRHQQQVSEAAVAIQKIFRGGATRKRRERERIDEEKKQRGVLRLQALTRGRAQRAKAAAIREAMQRAALRIQIAARRFLAKKQEEEDAQRGAMQARRRSSVAAGRRLSVPHMGGGRIPPHGERQPHRVSPPSKKGPGGGSPRKAQQQQQQRKRKAQPGSPQRQGGAQQPQQPKQPLSPGQQVHQQLYMEAQMHPHAHPHYYQQPNQQPIPQQQPLPRAGAGVSVSPPQQRRAPGGGRAGLLAHGELGRIYGLSGPRDMGPAGPGGPRSRRFVPVAATAAAAARAEEDGTYAFFPELPPGVQVDYVGSDVPRMSLLELEQQYYQRTEHAPKVRRSY